MEYGDGMDLHGTGVKVIDRYIGEKARCSGHGMVQARHSMAMSYYTRIDPFNLLIYVVVATNLVHWVAILYTLCSSCSGH